jgi:hypothetical protein
LVVALGVFDLMTGGSVSVAFGAAIGAALIIGAVAPSSPLRHATTKTSAGSLHLASRATFGSSGPRHHVITRP